MKTIITPANWIASDTGGGCTAFQCERGKVHFLITQREEPSIPTDASQPCDLGLYWNESGEQILFWECSCLAEAIAIADGAKTFN